MSVMRSDGWNVNTMSKNKRNQFMKIKRTAKYLDWFKEQYLALKGYCPLCNRPMTIAEYTKKDRFATCDHIIELSEGGGNGYNNLRLICNGCNRIKGWEKIKRLFDEW